MSKTLIAELKECTKVYASGDTLVTALHPTTLQIQEGEMILLIGPSGSGKTTLLSLLGCVIYPTEGEVYIDGIRINNLNDAELSDLRLKKIGFVFQNYNLVAPLTALENVMLPLQLLNSSKKGLKNIAVEALSAMGMAYRMNQIPKQLSGGQQQRVAIARALVNDPALVLCDEPTASLDPKSVEVIMNELKKLVKNGRTIIIVTHDMRLIPYADRIYRVDSGKVSENQKKQSRTIKII